MKKIIFAIIICVTTSFVGCSPQKDSRVAINFGEAQYKEPFRGIFASKPDILVKSLDWPVIKLFKPDTAIVCKTIELNFNEDAVRSNAIAEISLLGTSFQPNSNIQWYVNNTPLVDGKFTIKATLESQQIELKGKIHPIAGNKKLAGYLTLLSNDLDEVNSIQLTSDVNSIADWTCTHEYGWPILLWLIWLLLALLAVAIVAGVFFLLGYTFVAIGKGLVAIGKGLVGLVSSHHTSASSNIQNMSDKGNRSTKKHHKDNDYIREALRLEAKLYDMSYNIASKNGVLEQLRLHLESTKDTNPKLNEQCYYALKSNTQSALDKFNDFYKPTPKNSIGGHWSGERARSTFILSDQNAYYDDCKKNGMLACEYDDSFEPDFTKATYQNSIVDISDLYKIYSCEELKKRGGGKSSFQEVSQMRMAQNLDSELRMWWKNNHKNEMYNQYEAFWEWRDANNLLPHEDANCKTMRLVNRSVHKAFTHAGGISHAIAIKTYFEY